MTVRVRFAPSPTGYLHIGGARTALYNYLFAKAQKGTFVLRIEDTDLERSKKEYEELQIEDLKWLGVDYDEGPDKPGNYGPYRQSERLDIYKKYAQSLVDRGLAYYDFCTDDELEEMRERALKEGRPPHYEGKWRNEEFFEEAANRLASGEKAAIRFKAPGKSYTLHDNVRGRVVFPENMVGDFILIRSTGLPVYNFCCVVDDIEMKITHIIRGEDHLNNTVRQMMIYEALGSGLPEFAHVSLLIGKDRQKLSKRHGATSVVNYKEESYLPQAIANYLVLLGWSHPDEKEIFDVNDLGTEFDATRFSKAAAIYDLEKLKWVNGMHIRALPLETLQKGIEEFIENDHFYFGQSEDWKKSAIELYKNQIEFFSDFQKRIDEDLLNPNVEVTDKLKDVLSWETTKQIHGFLDKKVKEQKSDFLSKDNFDSLFNELKTDLKIKGKQLFMGTRVCLTGHDHGPELGDLVPIIPKEVMQKRLSNIATLF
ncbi:MAG: glutamate--tRNA ligase [Halobacteriovoraceae bacterium]|nr:glutamate--tRNA ligase [Halobacteriovoraceae bacterium]MCB9094028.1 glutamate--tRNA ligase [Halobacteriovoraceae bacterium]